MSKSNLTNVKAGDTVLVRKHNQWAYGLVEYFYVKATVDRATKTSIIIDKMSYSKISGKARGCGNGFILPYSVEDDLTEQYVEAAKKRLLIINIRNAVEHIRDIDAREYPKMTKDRLGNILLKLNEVKLSLGIV